MEDVGLKIEYISTNELVPYARNAKKHPESQVDNIVESIRTFGMNDPIGVWTNDDGQLEIVEGHGRLLALEKLGVDMVPIVKLDHMSDDERRAYTHIHNQTTMNSGFDDDILCLDIDELDFDWEEFGFDIVDEQVEKNVTPHEPDELKDIAERCSKGDIWQLGKHRLMCGDSTDIDSVNMLMNGNYADICFTSPPYNVTGSGGFKPNHTMKHAYIKEGGAYNEYEDNLDSCSYGELLQKSLGCALSCCDDVMFNIGCVKGALFGTAKLIGDNADKFSGIIGWHKQNAMPPSFSSQYGLLTNIMEPIYCFNRRGQRKFKHPQWKSYMNNVIETPNASGNKYANEHSATFPIELAIGIVENFSESSCLDLFGGTGTTLIACEQLGRTCYMMELDPHYCDIILARWEGFTGMEAVKAL